jgi:hypothetical protein
MRSHVEAAVDGQHASRDIACVVVDEELDRSRYFGRLSKAANRNTFKEFCECILSDRGNHLGLDITGSNAVNSDTLAGYLQCETLAESD